MFEFFEVERVGAGHAHGDVKPWSGAFWAIAIAAESEDDGLIVNGREVTIGCPLLLDGQQRTFNVQPLRLSDTAEAPVRTVLMGVTDKCGLAAIPRERMPRRYWSEDSGGGTHQLIVPFAGRKRATIIVEGAAAADLNVWGIKTYWRPITDLEVKTIADLIDVVDIGTVDPIGYVVEDEDFDALVVDLTNEAVATEIFVEVRGEAAR